MADETLVMLANDVRGKTLRLLEGVSEQEARFVVPGLGNTILWHAGHAVVVNEELGVSPATGKAPAYPQGWKEIFGWQSKPAFVKEWPSVEEVVTQLREQAVRLSSAIQSLTAEQLAQMVRERSLRYSIMHGLHDEACHQGEIWLLRKMWAKRG